MLFYRYTILSISTFHAFDYIKSPRKHKGFNAKLPLKKQKKIDALNVK